MGVEGGVVGVVEMGGWEAVFYNKRGKNALQFRPMQIPVAINGFGRVGRCVARALFSAPHPDFPLAAVNAPSGPELAAHLLKYDSIHGVFPADIRAGKNEIIVGGQSVRCLTERDFSKLPWKKTGARLVLECTGRAKTKSAAAAHLKQGAERVLVSAPMADADATVVYGVNHNILAGMKGAAEVVSNASCTTNCLAPVAKVLLAAAGIESGWMTTVHAQTADQNLTDGTHRDFRRARAAGVSLIPTSTGAADSIGLVIPQLAGKMSGLAVRAPVGNVSLLDLSCRLERPASAEELNDAFRAAARGDMWEVLAVEEAPLVSTDFNGRAESAIVDAAQTRVLNGRFAKILAWYDNEWGFARRMLDVAAEIGRTMD